MYTRAAMVVHSKPQGGTATRSRIHNAAASIFNEHGHFDAMLFQMDPNVGLCVEGRTKVACTIAYFSQSTIVSQYIRCSDWSVKDTNDAVVLFFLEFLE
jgi:hypothetical protein